MCNNDYYCGINDTENMTLKQDSETFIKLLTNDFFNTGADNFTKFLNRKDYAKKITLRMIKDKKNKNRHLKVTSIRSEEDISSWKVKNASIFIRCVMCFKW